MKLPNWLRTLLHSITYGAVDPVPVEPMTPPPTRDADPNWLRRAAEANKVRAAVIDAMRKPGPFDGYGVQPPPGDGSLGRCVGYEERLIRPGYLRCPVTDCTRPAGHDGLHVMEIATLKARRAGMSGFWQAALAMRRIGFDQPEEPAT